MNLWTPNIQREFKPLILLALPLVLSGLVEFSSGFAGTVMLGHVSPQAIAAGTLSNNIFSTFMVFFWGTLGAVGVLVSQRLGAQNEKAIIEIVQSALVLIAIVSPILMWFFYHASFLLVLFKQKPELISLAAPGLHGFAWAVFPDLISMMLLQFVMGLGLSRLNLIFSLLWAPLNMFFLAAFIFGFWHFPKLGVAGIGWGFAASAWLVAILLVTYLFFSKKFTVYRDQFLQSWQATWKKSLLSLGIPIGITYTTDLIYFLANALMMGIFSVAALAAHQIVMQYFWQCSVVSFAIGQAVTVRIGYHVGAQTYKSITPVAYLGIAMTAIIMILFAMMYWFFSTHLVQLDIANNPSPEVFAYAKRFFLFAGIVQIWQAGWIGYVAALRGLGDTRALMIITAFIELCVGIPLGYLLAFHFNFGPEGLWIAPVFDSCLFIMLAGWRFHNKKTELLLDRN